MSRILHFLAQVRRVVNDPGWTTKGYPLLLLLDLLLSCFIIRKISFTNIDFEAYMEEVEPVLARGETNYSNLNAGTGPIAYPAGFVYVYAVISFVTNGGKTLWIAQGIFLMFQMVTDWVLAQLYILGEAPLWTLGLALFSKRVHSIFLLRLFNDALAAGIGYASLLLLLQDRQILACAALSFAVSVKIGPLLYWAPFGLRLVLQGGWSRAVPKVVFMLGIQILLAIPFLVKDAGSYARRAFGGPGDLQQVWSVNWKFVPAEVFYHKWFPAVLATMYGVSLLAFLYKKWCPQGCLSWKCGLWEWKRLPDPSFEDNQLWVAFLFTCNFLGVALGLRTMHFQFAVWYYATVPFLAWYAIRPDKAGTFVSWLLRCAAVCAVTVAVEVSFLLTQEDVVSGPTGKQWTTVGTPTKAGSLLLMLTHFILILLLFFRVDARPVVTVIHPVKPKEA